MGNQFIEMHQFVLKNMTKLLEFCLTTNRVIISKQGKNMHQWTLPGVVSLPQLLQGCIN